jgi:hypothetical protein
VNQKWWGATESNRACLRRPGYSRMDLPHSSLPRDWWTLPESNRLPPACKASALPNELKAQRSGLSSETGKTPPDDSAKSLWVRTSSEHLPFRKCALPYYFKVSHVLRSLSNLACRKTSVIGPRRFGKIPLGWDPIRTPSVWKVRPALLP